jgi:hypothetical protein
LIEDRALGLFVAVAAVHQALEHGLHCESLLCLLLQVCDIRLSKRLDLPVGTPAFLPQAEQAADFIDREAKVPRSPDEL